MFASIASKYSILHEGKSSILVSLFFFNIFFLFHLFIGYQWIIEIYLTNGVQLFLLLLLRGQRFLLFLFQFFWAIFFFFQFTFNLQKLSKMVWLYSYYLLIPYSTISSNYDDQMVTILSEISKSACHTLLCWLAVFLDLKVGSFSMQLIAISY